MDVSFKFSMPSHPRYLAVVRAAVGELGAAYGLSEEWCLRITLAVDEAMANIIRHAYHGDYGQAIEVNCQACADRLEFTLLDRGEPPDPARIAAQPLDDVALSGRGTHLIRMIMDEVCYDRAPFGNRLRLVKQIPPPDAAAAEGRII